MEVQSRFLEREEGRLHYLEAGPRDGPAVLLLHGMKFNARTWEGLGTLQLLARKGYRVVALDLPGFGESAPSERPPEQVLEPLLTELALAKPVVVAPSMSGRYSFPVVVRHPEKLAGFVPIAPAGIDLFEKDLGAARVPALVVWGGADRVLPVAQAEKLARLMPDARTVIIEGADHACYLDKPEEFHKALLDFLGRVTKK
ncbi:MAG: alpha/beta fold hydrolase [Planctomycetota bacterium]